MLLKILNGDFDAFKKVWEQGSDYEQACLRSAVRMSYYLINRVWKVPDSLIAKMMHQVPLPNGAHARKVQEEWIKLFVAKHLGGKDLIKKFAKRKLAGSNLTKLHYRKSRADNYQLREFNTAEAYQFFMTLRKLAQDAEKPIPDFFQKLLDEKDEDKYQQMVEKMTKNRRGNPDEGDIAKRRLVQNLKRSSFFEEIKSVFDGITEEVGLVVEEDGSSKDKLKLAGVDDEGIVLFSLLIRRLVEKETELILLTAMENKDFNWVEYIKNRHEQLDQERYRHYPEILKAVNGLLNTTDWENFRRLMERIIGAPRGAHLTTG